MQRRSLVTMIILTIVTLGIYQLLWIYFTNKELRSKGMKVLPVMWLFLPFLLLVGIALLQFLVRFAFNQAGNDPNIGGTLVNLLSIVLGIIAILAVIPVALYWFYRYCQGLEQVTNKEISLGFSLGLLAIFAFFGVTFLWPFIIQYRLNELTDNTPNVADTPYPTVV